MDISQVALGAALGAAVAVNAALQSLQDAGSFLIHTPGSRTNSLELPSSTRDARKRALSFDDVEEDEEGFLNFADVEDEDELGITLEDGDVGGSLSTNSPSEGAEGSMVPKASNEQKSRTDNCDPHAEQSTVPGDCSKRRKLRGPPVLPAPILPCLPPVAQSEEIMSLMLQQTTETVLNTLADARRRRERMLLDTKNVNIPERESSLKLVNSFIDALVNVSDSLKIVQSALFFKKEEPP